MEVVAENDAARGVAACAGNNPGRVTCEADAQSNLERCFAGSHFVQRQPDAMRGRENRGVIA